MLVYFDRHITPEAEQRVAKLLRLLESEPLAGVSNLHPGYSSLLIKFDPLRLSHAGLEAGLATYLNRLDGVRLPEPRQVEIPVAYGGDFGPDLDYVAEAHGLTPSQVIEQHAASLYRVCFLGFVPGFAYLAGLPETLVTPRLHSPRPRVPAGSVGIGGAQTGVYPFSTPGGWRLIGRTPLAMFRPDGREMSRLSIGDRVRFAPISPARFSSAA